MWKLFGIMILLSHAVIGNTNYENAYYLNQAEEDNRSSEPLENQEGTKLGSSEVASLDEGQENDQQQSENGSLLDYSRLKSEPKRSIVHLDLRDKMPERRQVPAPFATLLYWPNQQDQVIGMEDRRNPLIQERRNPSFSPWGGKRSIEQYKTVAKIRRPVRVPFNSWGGKRSVDKIHIGDIKRDEPMNAGAKKTTPFNSWGGKRSMSDFDGAKRIYNSNDRWIISKSERDEKMSSNFDTDPLIGKVEYLPRSDEWFNREIEVKREPQKLFGNGDLSSSGKMMRNNLSRNPFGTWYRKRGQEFALGSDDPSSKSITMTIGKNNRLKSWTE